MELEIWTLRLDSKEDLHHENIASCMDNLLISSKSPQIISDALDNKHNFKLKCDEPTSHHYGCDFTRDGSNELCLASHKNIDKMLYSHASMFGLTQKSSCH